MIEKVDTLEKIEEILKTGSKFRIGNIDGFNRCVYHICNLIKDSYNLYKNESYSTSLFLSITIIEEVGKTYMGSCVRDPKEIEDDLKKSNLMESKTVT